MKKIRSFFYLLGQGFLGIVRNSNMSFASVLILVSCMLIIGIFGPIIKIIDLNTNFDDLNIIVAYVKTSVELDDAQAEQLRLQISEMSNVVDVVYVSKEEAKRRMEEKGFNEIDDVMGGNNPLPATYEISFENPEQAHIIINNVNKIDEIQRTVDKMEDVEKINDIKRAIMIIAVIMLAVLFVVSLFVIMNAIKLGVFARRNEIAIMRYMGATNGFIVTPFIVEGLLLGIISAAVAVGVEYYLYTYVIADVLNGGMGNAMIAPNFTYFLGEIILFFTAIGVFTGIGASSVSVKKYCKA